MDDKILREAERANITGVGRTAWRELERLGLAPRRRRLTRSTVGWLATEVLEWMRTRSQALPDDVASRNTGTAPVGTDSPQDASTPTLTKDAPEVPWHI